MKKDILVFCVGDDRKDPISIIRADMAGGSLDNKIPLLAVYNGYHYESVYPESQKDQYLSRVICTEFPRFIQHQGEFKKVFKQFLDGMEQKAEIEGILDTENNWDCTSHIFEIGENVEKEMDLKNPVAESVGKEPEIYPKNTKSVEDVSEICLSNSKEKNNIDKSNVDIDAEDQNSSQDVDIDSEGQNSPQDVDIDAEGQNSPQDVDIDAEGQNSSQGVDIVDEDQNSPHDVEIDAEGQNSLENVKGSVGKDSSFTPQITKGSVKMFSTSQSKRINESVNKTAKISDILTNEKKITQICCSHFLLVKRNMSGKDEVLGAPKMNSDIGHIVKVAYKRYIQVAGQKQDKSCTFCQNNIHDFGKENAEMRIKQDLIFSKLLMPGFSQEAKVKKCFDKNLPPLTVANQRVIQYVKTNENEKWAQGDCGKALNIEKYEGRFKCKEQYSTQKDPVRTRKLKDRKLLARKKRNCYKNKMKKNQEKERQKFKQKFLPIMVPKWKKVKNKHSDQNLECKKINEDNQNLKVTNGRTISKNILNEIQEKIKSIEVTIAVKNTVKEITEVENENILKALNKVLGEYKGRGEPSKNTTDKSLEKVGETGKCAIDSLLNLLRNTEVKTCQEHKLCKHTQKCNLCIVRSALLKIETNKGKKKIIKLPEIMNNLQLFLGNSYCRMCFLPDVQKEIHSCPLLKPANISLKYTLETFLKDIPTPFSMTIRCEKCSIDLTADLSPYFKVSRANCLGGKLSSGIKEMVKEIQKKHSEKSNACRNSKVCLQNIPNNFLVMMEAGSVTHFEKKLSMGDEDLYYSGQINYKNGLLSKHFSTTLETQHGTFVKYSGKDSKLKDRPNVSKSILMLYTKRRAEIPIGDFIYKGTAMKYFKYDPSARHQKHKGEYNPEANRLKYDQIARHQKHKGEYDPIARHQKHEGEYDPEANRLKYDQIARHQKHEKELQKNIHKSGFQSVCISCTRWGNNQYMIKTEHDIETKFPKFTSAAFFLREDLKFEGSWRMCITCYSSFKREKIPRLNMRTLKDFMNIGSLPYGLPKLNTLEAYLIKLRIPFLRLANMPRSPNLKVFGSMVCVSANIDESMQRIQNRLSLQSSTLIPVNFKRKLTYTGSYMSKIIDATKVFTWLDYLKKHNTLYADLVYDKVQMSDDIKNYENQLLREAADFDDQKENEEDKTEELYSESDESSEEEELNENKEDSKNTKEYRKEDPVEPHDTLLIDVRQANIEENTFTNHIADAILAKEQECLSRNKESEDDSDEETTKLQNEDELAVKTKQNSKPKITKKPAAKEGKVNKKEKVLNVAPGEGGKIDNTARFGEAECFPELFPTGKGTYLSYVESKQKLKHLRSYFYIISILDGINIGLSLYNKMRLTGGLHLTDEEKVYIDKDLENKIINFEKDSRIDYARFR